MAKDGFPHYLPLTDSEVRSLIKRLHGQEKMTDSEKEDCQQIHTDLVRLNVR